MVQHHDHAGGAAVLHIRSHAGKDVVVRVLKGALSELELKN